MGIGAGSSPRKTAGAPGAGGSRSARSERLLLVLLLFLDLLRRLLLARGPGRRDAVAARVGDRLAEVFVGVGEQQHVHAARGHLAAEQLDLLLPVTVRGVVDRLVKMREGVLERLHDVVLLGERLL